MEVFGPICYYIVLGLSLVLLWGVLLLSLLIIGGFIRINTWGNFNCSFSMWESNISFDSLKLLIVFIIFEMEVVVIVMMLSYVIIFVLIFVTVFELIMLYL